MARKTSDGDGITKVTISSGDKSVEFDSVTDFARAAANVAQRARAKTNAQGQSDPDAPVSRLAPPAKVAFMGSEWVESEPLKELAEELIEKWPELRFLDGHPIRVLWKAEGGENKGRSILGKCNKPGGYARYFALCDWVIWLAADHCRQLEFTDEQIEALLYHELKHCTLVGDAGKPGVRGHDYEVFADELNRYGFWNQGRESLKRTVQGRLQFEEAHP